MSTVEPTTRVADHAISPSMAVAPPTTTAVAPPMSTAVAPPTTTAGEMPRLFTGDVKRLARRMIKRALILAALVAVGVAGWLSGYVIVPAVLAFYFACGLLDVLRNNPRDMFTIDSYFFGNGVVTWLLSPFNLLMDAIALPYWNKGVYQLRDLPGPIQEEINDLIRSSHESDIIEQLESRIGDGRSMMFFKWYGRNLRNSIEIPAFHQQYRYIRTIGVSVFNKRKSTSWHFGPLRATFRVLYNLRPSADDTAFIQVGRHVHRWNQNPLFIFDDTLMHQSCNETDAVRFCMFVDIVRPSCCPPLARAIVTGLQTILVRMRFVFYKRWAEMR